MKGRGQREWQRFVPPVAKKEELVKNLVALAEKTVVAKRFLKDLKRIFPRTRKMDLLPVALHRGGKIAAELLVEEIERNQVLLPDDRLYLQRFKAELQTTKDCPTH